MLNLSLPNSSGFIVVNLFNVAPTPAPSPWIRRALVAGLAAGLISFPGLSNPPALQVNDFCPPLVIQSKPARLLKFPRDYSLGELYVLYNGQDERDPSIRQGAARGEMKVDAAKIVILNAGYKLFKDPALINTIAPQSIDVLKLTSISLDDAEDGLCDRALKYVGHLKGLLELNINRSDATDAGLVHAAELPDLMRISACYTLVRGTCLKQICTLKKLRMLRLSGTPLQEAQLQYIIGLPLLEYLTVSRTGLTNVGLKQISKCGKLVSLDISQNPDVDDKALADLKTLKNLKALSLSGCKISINGLIQLKGLPLRLLVMPLPSYQKSVIDQVHKTFPQAEISLRGIGKVDSETRDLYAPIH